MLFGSNFGWNSFDKEKFFKENIFFPFPFPFFEKLWNFRKALKNFFFPSSHKYPSIFTRKNRASKKRKERKERKRIKIWSGHGSGFASIAKMKYCCEQRSKKEEKRRKERIETRVTVLSISWIQPKDVASVSVWKRYSSPFLGTSRNTWGFLV